MTVLVAQSARGRIDVELAFRIGVVDANMTSIDTLR